MDNIEILIILLLIFLFLENKKNINDKDEFINYLAKGVLIYVIICLLTKKKTGKFYTNKL